MVKNNNSKLVWSAILAITVILAFGYMLTTCSRMNSDTLFEYVNLDLFNQNGTKLLHCGEDLKGYLIQDDVRRDFEYEERDRILCLRFENEDVLYASILIDSLYISTTNDVFKGVIDGEIESMD